MKQLSEGEHLGTGLSTAALPSLRLTEVDHGANHRTPLHRHLTDRICILAQGSLSEATGREQLDFPGGSVVFWRAGATHSDKFGPGANRSVHIDVGTCLPHEVRDLLPSQNEWATSVEKLEIPLRRLRTLPEVAADADFDTVEGIVWELIGRAARLRGSGGKPLELVRAHRFVSDHLAMNLTTRVVADALRVSKRRLAEHFRVHTGGSLCAYVQSMRVRAAALALTSNTAVAIADIAVELGFYDQSHFTRVFRSVTGMTPAAYRQRNVNKSTASASFNDTSDLGVV